MVYNRVDFRKLGLIPMKKYIISNKETGEIYGEFKIGPIGGLNQVGKRNYQLIDEIKFNVHTLEFKEVVD